MDRLEESAAPAARADAVTLKDLLRGPATVVWLVLVLATTLSWWLGEGHGSRQAATVAVIVVAFVKVFLVGWYFMEVRATPLPFRLAFAAWVVLVGGALVVLYLAGD